MMRGKVVLVPFPFDDLTTTKVRPAVCLTEPIGPHRHVILAFITSRAPTPLLLTDIVLDPGQPDFSMTGLQVPSTIRLHRLMTVSTAMIVRELGVLPSATHRRVVMILKSDLLHIVEGFPAIGGTHHPTLRRRRRSRRCRR
jgi:mRNA interferase MazF